MTSGAWITLFIPVCLAVFVGWEFAQLYRRRKGNRSAYTMSQYVTRKAKAGSTFFRWFILVFSVFIALVGLALIFHWEVPCIWWDVLCEVTF